MNDDTLSKESALSASSFTYWSIQENMIAIHADKQKVFVEEDQTGKFAVVDFDVHTLNWIWANHIDVDVSWEAQIRDRVDGSILDAFFEILQFVLTLT